MKQILSIAFVFTLVLSILGAMTAQDEEQPFLGIGFEAGEQGALVTRVVPDSAAEVSGVQAGDIITAVDGAEVTAETLAETIQAYAVGDTIVLTVQRDGESLDLDVTLTARPEAQSIRVRPLMAERPYLGVSLEDGDEGVIVQDVAPGSPAAEAGIEAGDMLLSVNETPVENSAALADFIRMLEPGETITLEMSRAGETVTLEAVLGAAPMRERRMLAQDLVLYNTVDSTWQVLGLAEDGPLFEAGLRPGDVIISIDGNAYDPQTLSEFLDGLDAADSVTLAVERDGETLEFTVAAGDLNRLNRFDLRGMERFAFPDGQNVRLGVSFVSLDEQIAADNNLDVTEGALIEEVLADTPAAAAGLQAGDVIVAVDGDKVDAERTLRDRLFAYEPDDTVTLEVLRDGETLQVDVTLVQMSFDARPFLGLEELPFDFEFDGRFPRFFGPDGFEFEMPAPLALPNV